MSYSSSICFWFFVLYKTDLLHPKESSSSGSSTGDSSTSDSSSGRSWSYTGNSAGGGDENGAAAVRSGVANFPWMLIGVAAVATVGGVYAHKSVR